MGFWDGSGISWTICKQSAPHCRQITTPTPHQSMFTGRVRFLTPNQQYQSSDFTCQLQQRISSRRCVKIRSPFLRLNVDSARLSKKGKGSPYSITERRVPEVIPVLGSQSAGGVSHKPDGRLPLLSARPAVTLATLKRLLPVSLLGEQRYDGCEQFAQDCQPTVSLLRFEAGPFCA